MKAKASSTAQKRATSLHGFQRYRIVVPPPGCRDVDGGLEFPLLGVAPWLLEKYDADPAERDLLEHKGLYDGLNFEVLRGYAGLFNERLTAGASGERFFSTQEPLLNSLGQCHRQAVELWKTRAETYREFCRNFQTRAQKNRREIQELVVNLEARKRDVLRLQRCMARIAGKRTEPIVTILKATGEEPAVVFGGSLADTRRDLDLLENHCKLQRIAITDARLLLHLVERGLTPEFEEHLAGRSGEQPGTE